MVVAIDGPGGAGKTTVARAVGERLGLPVLDTGALYRAATLAVLRAGAPPDDAGSVEAVVAGITLGFEEGRVTLDGEDVTEAIRADEVDEAVSAVSSHPRVRDALVPVQRRWVADRGGTAVVEGRDIGSIVFPAAAVKVFLTARPEVRARRRAAEHGTPEESVGRLLARRDDADAGRAVAPLRAADDAVVIDTSELVLDEVVKRVLAVVEERRD